eukprot:3562293-Amphidinium_carterae.2
MGRPGTSANISASSSPLGTSWIAGFPYLTKGKLPKEAMCLGAQASASQPAESLMCKQDALWGLSRGLRAHLMGTSVCKDAAVRRHQQGSTMPSNSPHRHRRQSVALLENWPGALQEALAASSEALRTKNAANS